MVDEYLLSLEAEISQPQPRFNLKTIYLGGGTPNSLDDSQLEKLLQLLQKIDQTAVVEYTIELNPERITKSQLQLLKKYHVNRLSIGVQTFSDQLLENSRKYANWTQQKTEISLADYYFQILMMGLRILEGINLGTVKDAQAAVNYYEVKITAEVAKNNLVFENNHLRCTKQGLNILNDILVCKLYYEV